MATLAELITAIRRRVADNTSPYTYADADYERALTFALGKLNFDWDTSFATVADVTTQYLFLLEKLATIEMCYVRAAEVPSGQAGDYQAIQVPDLAVYKIQKSASDLWMGLADRLQKEYDGELESGQEGGDVDGSIASVQMIRQSARTYSVRPYPLAEKIDAPAITATVDGTDVTLTWTPVYTTYFAAYEIWRADNAEMTSAERQVSLSDNHDEEWTDEGVAAGTYYYMLRLVDTNEFETDSASVEAVVS